MVRFGRLVFFTLLIPVVTATLGLSQSAVTLQVVSVDTSRDHMVPPGKNTTFVLALKNSEPQWQSVSVDVVADLPGQVGWSAQLFAADELFRPTGQGGTRHDILLAPGGTRHFVTLLGAPLSSVNGDEGRALVSARTSQGTPVARLLPARVRTEPKMYFVSLDGCGAGYLYLGRDGRPFESGSERLMPRTWEFLTDAALLQNSLGQLPASTDMNHLSILTGSWPGTLGLPSAGVRRYYAGLDPETQSPQALPGSKSLLRWGAEGRPIRTLFDTVKHDPGIGSQDAFIIHLSGKEWLGNLHRDGLGTVDIITGPVLRPFYVPAPQAYRLGDPPSDPDAATDRDGTNFNPPALRRLFHEPHASIIMNNPLRWPEDRWTMNAAIRMLYAEDPDVLYINLASCDEGQHYLGAADRPIEWMDSGTPDVLWDDVNIYNRTTNRDAMLDIVFEADACFGLLLDQLRTKGVFDGSLVTLFSDHGQITIMEESTIDLESILADGGIDTGSIEYGITVGDVAHLHLREAGAEATLAQMEERLQDYRLTHPVSGEVISPFIVITRAEMGSGVDDIWGPLAENGITGDKRGELYSEWNIDFPVDDNSKIKWPHMWVFTRGRFSFSTFGQAFFKGSHSSPATTWVMLALHGPGIEPGIYTDAARLADVTPTFYQLLGVDIPAQTDGRAMNWILSR